MKQADVRFLERPPQSSKFKLKFEQCFKKVTKSPEKSSQLSNQTNARSLFMATASEATNMYGVHI